MTFITADILGGSIGLISSLLLGVAVTYVSILKASSNLRKKLIIKTAFLVWLGVVSLLAVPLWFSYSQIFPEWMYWTGVGSFLMIFIPFINSYYKRKANSLTRPKSD